MNKNWTAFGCPHRILIETMVLENVVRVTHGESPTEAVKEFDLMVYRYDAIYEWIAEVHDYEARAT